MPSNPDPSQKRTDKHKQDQKLPSFSESSHHHFITVDGFRLQLKGFSCVDMELR